MKKFEKALNIILENYKNDKETSGQEIKEKLNLKEDKDVYAVMLYLESLDLVTKAACEYPPSTWFFNPTTLGKSYWLHKEKWYNNATIPAWIGAAGVIFTIIKSLLAFFVR